MLLYAHAAFPGLKHILAALISLPLICISAYFLVFKKRKYAVFLCSVMCISAGLISLKGCFEVYSGLKEFDLTAVVNYDDNSVATASVEPVIKLSKDGRNVVIIMLDKAIGGYIPYIFKEKPELYDKFDGFTWYPDMASFTAHTNLAFFPITGGYEYTPYAMAERKDEPLSDKIDEALKVLPVLFSDNGFSVTLCDIPYAGMKEVPNMHIYDEYENIDTCLLHGRYNSAAADMDIRSSTEHNFLYYSIYRTVFPAFCWYIYNKGFWLSADSLGKTVITINNFMDNYTLLDLMPELTDVSDDSGDHFTFMDNETTHEYQLLQLPDYVPADNVDNSAYFDESLYEIDGRKMKMDDEVWQMVYHTNMASMLKLAEWFDHLREQGVYDNTRIILVSDHGQGLHQFDDLILSDELDVQAFNSLLLVKDFDSAGFNTDYSFMTDADIPSLSMSGLIADPVNPFTGSPISMEPKSQGINITTSDNYHINDPLLGSNGYAFDTSDGSWYHLSGSLFNPSNRTK